MLFITPILLVLLFGVVIDVVELEYLRDSLWDISIHLRSIVGS